MFLNFIFFQIKLAATVFYLMTDLYFSGSLIVRTILGDFSIGFSEVRVQSDLLII